MEKFLLRQGDELLGSFSSSLPHRSPPHIILIISY